MLIRTRNFAIVGLPWSGIRGVGRAALECGPAEWATELLPKAGVGDVERCRQGGSLVLALVCHPAHWYADFWAHRHLHEALGLGGIAEATTLEEFVAGRGRGLLTGLVAGAMGRAPEAVLAVRVEHFVADVRRATRGGYQWPPEIIPMFKVVQDAMNERQVPSPLGQVALAGDPLFRALGYTDHGCGTL